MDLALQKELFSEVLNELDTGGDLTNQILEVTLEDDEAGIQIEGIPRSEEGCSIPMRQRAPDNGESARDSRTATSPDWGRMEAD